MVVSWSKYVVHLIALFPDYHLIKSIVEAPVALNETIPKFYVTGQAINLPAIVITIAITLLLISGIRPTSIVNLILVIIKIIILLIFIYACSTYVKSENYKPFFRSNSGRSLTEIIHQHILFHILGSFSIIDMLDACTYVFFSYVGFDSVAAVAQEARPPTAYPLAFAIIAPIVISSLIYIGVCSVRFGLIPYESLASDDPLYVGM